MNTRPFAPGFRFSILDAAIIGGAICASFFLGITNAATCVVLFVVGHFFLFCNVFRVTRVPELCWGILFTTLYLLSVFFGIPPLAVVYLLSLFATVYIVVKEMKRPDYHGFAWERINPKLPEWWATRGVS